MFISNLTLKERNSSWAAAHSLEQRRNFNCTIYQSHIKQDQKQLET